MSPIVWRGNRRPDATPFAGGAIEAWQVGPDVGNVRNNRPELLDRFALV
jgi:hypothetical protein